MVGPEEAIMEGLGNLRHVDGHDAGSGETNIFILTDEPKAAFERIKRLSGIRAFMPDLKGAFRVIGEVSFVFLHPTELAHFEIA